METLEDSAVVILEKPCVLFSDSETTDPSTWQSGKSVASIPSGLRHPGVVRRDRWPRNREVPAGRQASAS
jgi:hypothetical protein